MVDDVPENVRLLEAVLVPRGYDVVSVSVLCPRIVVCLGNSPLQMSRGRRALPPGRRRNL